MKTEFNPKPYGSQNVHLERYKDGDLRVTLTYPNVPVDGGEPRRIQAIQINQESVRASDGIRVHYDYDRDGFVIEQPEPYEVEGDNVTSILEKWIEVAFCKSWQFDKEEK